MQEWRTRLRHGKAKDGTRRWRGRRVCHCIVINMLDANDSRIRSLEGQVTAIQSTLTDLVSTLRANMAGPSQPMPPVIAPPPAPIDLSMFTGQNFGFPPKQEILLPFHGSDPGSTPSYRSQPSPYIPVQNESGRVNTSMPALPLDFFRPPAASVPESRLGSPGADQDLLAPEEITNPLGALSNMAGLVEAAVERAREEQSSPAKRPADASDAGRPFKKTRFSPEEPSGPVIVEEAQSVLTSGPKRRRVKRTHIHAYPDAVAEGYLSEQEGRELVQL